MAARQSRRDCVSQPRAARSEPQRAKGCPGFQHSTRVPAPSRESRSSSKCQDSPQRRGQVPLACPSFQQYPGFAPQVLAASPGFCEPSPASFRSRKLFSPSPRLPRTLRARRTHSGRLMSAQPFLPIRRIGNHHPRRRHNPAHPRLDFRRFFRLNRLIHKRRLNK